VTIRDNATNPLPGADEPAAYDRRLAEAERAATAHGSGPPAGVRNHAVLNRPEPVRPFELLTIEITVASGDFPVDLALIAVGAPLGSAQRSLVAIQLGPGPLDGLAGILDHSARLLSSSVSALLELAPLHVDLLVQGVEPAFPLVRRLLAFVRQLLTLVREPFPFIRQMFALVGATVAIRDVFVHGSGVMRNGQDPARVVRENRIRLSHIPSVRSPLAR